MSGIRSLLRAMGFCCCWSAMFATAVAQPPSRATSAVPSEASSVAPQNDLNMAPKIEVVQLDHMPAVDVANTITNVLGIDQDDATTSIVIVPEPVGNSVAISAPPPLFDGIASLIKRIDVPQALIQIDIAVLQVVDAEPGAEHGLVRQYQGRLLDSEQVAEFLKAVAQDSSVEVLARPNLIVLNNQPGFLRLVKDGNAERTERALTLGVTARATRLGHISFEMDIDVPVSEDEMVLQQTSVSLASGQGVVIGDFGIGDTSSRPNYAILATAKLLN